MSVHVATKATSYSKRIKGLRLIESGAFTQIAIGHRHPSWVKLATRLRSRGFSVSITQTRLRLYLVTSANFEEVEACLVSRVARRKLPRLAIVSTFGFLLATLAFIPLPKPQGIQTAKVQKEVPCAIDKIRDALMGRNNFKQITIKPTIRLGGVESGEIICEDHRYSYTLDLREAKRVLKLLELNS